MSLGPHVITPSVTAMDWARIAPVVKVLDNAWALKQARPDALRIFRHYFANQDINRNGADVADEVLHYLADGPATHIELFNEVASKLGQGLERHVAMTAEAVAYVQQVRPDLTVIGFSIATGNIEQADWDYLRAHKFGNVKVLGWHHYWGNQGFSPWEALRYRSYWRPGDPLLALTEVGRDRVEGGKGGWKADGLSASQYAAEVNAYVAEVAKDKQVIAVTPFTSGPTVDWDTFDMDPVSAMLTTTSPPPQPGGNTVTTFAVGQGVKDLMTQHSDTPQSDEHYVVDEKGNVFKSETFGGKGLYQWNKQANKTVLIPFG